jgi:hypothetical protein
MITGGLEHGQGMMALVRGHEEIEILGFARDAGIMPKGVGAPNEKWYLSFTQCRERLLVEGLHFGLPGRIISHV